MRETWTSMMVVSALVALAASGAFAESYAIDWYTVDGGGGMGTSGGDYEVSGTIGQPDAYSAPASGSQYVVTGGFWVVGLPTCTAFAPVDFDRDCDVDMNDFAVFESCASGPEVPREYTAGCEAADLDTDGDVDQSDFSGFQRCHSGQGNPADPACAD